MADHVHTTPEDEHDNAYAGLLVNAAHWAFGTDFEDPLAGYGPAHGDMAVGGMGLWLARRSVDDLVAAPAQESGEGCVVRLLVHA